jgi:hypothetical protein
MMAAIVGTYSSSAFVHKPRSLSLTKITIIFLDYSIFPRTCSIWTSHHPAVCCV